MKLTIKLSTPTGNRRRSILSAFSKKTVQPIQKQFAIDKSRSEYTSFDLAEKGPFELAPREARFFCGILAQTSDAQNILGVTDYIGGSHSYLYDLVLSRLDEGAHFLWGGEFMLVGSADASGIGTLVQANETSGWFHRLRDKKHVDNDINHLRRFILGARELPFHVSPQVELFSFDPKRQHLVEEANRFVERTDDNLRHCLNNKIGILRMSFQCFLNDRDSVQNRRQNLLENFQDCHEIIAFVLGWIQKYYPDHAQDIGHIPSLDQITNCTDDDLKELIEEYQKTLKNLYNYINRSNLNNVTHGNYDFYEIDQKAWWERLGL